MVWKVDDRYQVELRGGIFGTGGVWVSGFKLAAERGQGKEKNILRFKLPDGRPAEIGPLRWGAFLPGRELRVAVEPVLLKS